MANRTLLVVIMLFGMFQTQALAQFGNLDGKLFSEKNNYTWRDLDFVFTGSDNSVTKVTFKHTYALSPSWEKSLSSGGISRFKVAKEFEISDKKMLEFIECSLSVGSHRNTLDTGLRVTSQRIGTIVVLLSDGKEVPIQIWADGFFLGDRSRYEDDQFFSWGLAKVLQDCSSDQGQVLAIENFNVLSGHKLDQREYYPRKSGGSARQQTTKGRLTPEQE